MEWFDAQFAKFGRADEGRRRRIGRWIHYPRAYRTLETTFVVQYPVQLYPAEQFLPVRSVEVAIWPEHT
jgi:hypothetical protein